MFDDGENDGTDRIKKYYPFFIFFIGYGLFTLIGEMSLLSVSESA